MINIYKNSNMGSKEETSPFTYSKNKNIFARTFRQINESLELTDKDIKILAVFIILRVVDVTLTYIFYNKRNAYHLIRFLDYIVLLSSFIITSLIVIKKENLKRKNVMSSIFFNFVFITFDLMSFIFYFVFEVRTVIILISLILNEIWLIVTSILLIKIIRKLMNIVRINKKNGYDNGNHGNSSFLRKKY